MSWCGIDPSNWVIVYLKKMATWGTYFAQALQAFGASSSCQGPARPSAAFQHHWFDFLTEGQRSEGKKERSTWGMSRILNWSIKQSHSIFEKMDTSGTCRAQALQAFGASSCQGPALSSLSRPLIWFSLKGHRSEEEKERSSWGMSWCGFCTSNWVIVYLKKIGNVRYLLCPSPASLRSQQQLPRPSTAFCSLSTPLIWFSYWRTKKRRKKGKIHLRHVENFELIHQTES